MSVRYRKDDFGWGEIPLEEAAAALGRAFGVAFEPREGAARGSYFKGEFPGVDIVVLDNYESNFPHEEGDNGPQMEPKFPEHRTLLCVESTDPTWWDERGYILDTMVGLERLRSRSWDVPDD
jgi:hypothetical protein